MASTEEEFEEWHRAKLQREFRPTPEYREQMIARCIHCGQPFGWSSGTIHDDFAICDACDGD